MHFATREFGDFIIRRDTVSPVINPVSVNGAVARFKIRDELSGIAKFEATVNGKWLLMMYDSKSNTISSQKLNKAEPLKGDLRLTVTDLSGNTATFRTTIP